MKREQKYDDADGRRYLLIHKKIVCNGLRLVNPATSPKIAERIRSSQAMMPTSGYARNSRDTIPIPENWFMSRNSDSCPIGNFGPAGDQLGLIVLAILSQGRQRISC
jgi:hypothetical protein